MHDSGALLSVDHETPGGHLALWNVDPLSMASVVSEYSTSTNNEGETSLHHSRWYFDLIYMSYWQDCFRVVDASDANNLLEVAVYDTIQPNPNTLYRGFWGCYPYLPSRNVLVTDPQVGLIVLDYVNDGPGIFTNPIDSVVLLGDKLRGNLSGINGNPIDTSASYVYYRWAGQNSWQKTKIRNQGAPDSFYFEIGSLSASYGYLDYYLQLKGDQGQKTRSPGLAPFLDFYRVKIKSAGTTIPELYLSEISDGTLSQNAFLEIYNASGTDIDLSAAKVVRCAAGSDNAFQLAAYVFDFNSDESQPSFSTMVPAYGFLIVANGSDRSTFENEWGTLPPNTNFNPGSSDLHLGQGSGTRWVLLSGGNANQFDGIIVDQTPTNVGGENQYAYQQSPGSWLVTSDRASATPGALGNDQSLPVTLSVFRARFEGLKVVLEWETASESDNLGFLLLRKSDREKTFSQIDDFRTCPLLKSKGSSALGHPYAYVDSTIAPGLSYQYILGSVAADGSVTLHDTIKVMPQNDVQVARKPLLVRCFPNPFNSQITITVQLKVNDQPLHIKIFDIRGRLIKTFAQTEGTTNPLIFTWRAKDDRGKLLPSGIYLLTVVQGAVRQEQKLLLIR